MLRKMMLVLLLCCVAFGVQVPPPRGCVVSRSNPLVKGLVGAWDPSIQGPGGNTLMDFSGHRNDLSMTNVTWAVGENGTCLQFSGDGVASRLITVALPFTIVTWANCDPSGRAIIASLGDSGGIHYHALAADPVPTPPLCWTYDGSNSIADAYEPWTAGQWHQLAFVVESVSRRTTYYDGVIGEVNTDTQNSITQDRFTLGVSADSTPYAYLTGLVGNTLLYDRALTSSEIEALSVDPYAWIRPVNTDWLYADTGATPPAEHFQVIMISAIPLGILGLALGFSETKRTAA